MILGYFDYLVLGILLFLNVKFWKIENQRKSDCLIGGIFFSFILPFISTIIEIERVKMTSGIMDNFEIIYTILRFPIYWILGILQLIVFGIKWKIKKNAELINDEQYIHYQKYLKNLKNSKPK